MLLGRNDVAIDSALFQCVCVCVCSGKFKVNSLFTLIRSDFYPILILSVVDEKNNKQTNNKF